MSWRLLGAVMIVVSCGIIGYLSAIRYKQTILTLQQLMNALNIMECELLYRLMPLPELLLKVSQTNTGLIGMVCKQLIQELESQISPNVSRCMGVTLEKIKGLPDCTAELLKELGQSLGKYHLEGQLLGIAAVRKKCQGKIEAMEKDQDGRLRRYQMFGLCAGAVIVILLI